MSTLGLDLGSNSIGWALIDEQARQIVATGVRIFPEGVDRDQKGGELSKNESRRVARGMRRQIRRRARRKKLLREALVIAGLLPASPDDQAALDRTNPYELRRRALDERLTPFEIGRILVHLDQRRGFLSNRKADREKKKEASEMLAEISQLEQEIHDAGHRTLGEHLAAKLAADPLSRIRKRHTRREMYLKEFDSIWTAQAKLHPTLLTDAIKYGASGAQPSSRIGIASGGGSAELLRRFGVHGLIFFQRPMYWPKSVVGQCEYDPKQKRCPRADRAAQRFRVLQEVNNLRIIAGDGEIKELNSVQRQKLLKLLGEKDEVKFDEIRKKLGLLESDGFNLEAGSRRKLLGMATDSVLASKKRYGKAWYELPETVKNSIVRSLIHDDETTFLKRADLEWQIAPDIAEKMADAPLPDGYASLGRETIERLLPFLEQGLPLMTRDSTPCALRLAGFLAPWERPVKGGSYLPTPPELTNPIVRQALYEVRKLVNAIVKEYGRPDAIHIELAREVKGSATQREEQAHQMREREARRDAIAKRLQEEYGEKPTRAKIERYILWEEQGEVCIYSGREISIRQLLAGEADVDHVLPYSKSLDDSLMNKVVCFRSENDNKGQRTVHEWLASTNPAKYEQVLQRAAKLPIEIRNRKRPKFSQKTCELEQFINRQLTDTAYITSAVVDYVKCLGADVLGSKGQLTAEVRHQWGLNDVLRDDGLNLKNRDDHRHHAVDAIVIALTDRSRLQQLAKCNGSLLKEPWPEFRASVVEAVNSINVSHRVRRKVAGALHEETIYGPTPKPGVFVYRKALESLTPAMIEDIRDPAIRQIVTARLAKFGIKPGDKKKIPAETWKEPLKMPSDVTIKKVRLTRRDQTIRPLGEGRTGHVKPGSTHHILLFELPGGKRELVAVSMLEAMQRLKRREPVVQRKHPTNADAKFLLSLSQNEMVLLEHGGQQGLYRFDTAAATSGQMWFRFHTAGGKSSEKLGEASKRPNTIKARKVTVDTLGRVRWAND